MAGYCMNENTAHEYNIHAILHSKPLNDVLILYLVNNL